MNAAIRSMRPRLVRKSSSAFSATISFFAVLPKSPFYPCGSMPGEKRERVPLIGNNEGGPNETKNHLHRSNASAQRILAICTTGGGPRRPRREKRHCRLVSPTVERRGSEAGDLSARAVVTASRVAPDRTRCKRP